MKLKIVIYYLLLNVKIIKKLFISLTVNETKSSKVKTYIDEILQIINIV